MRDCDDVRMRDLLPDLLHDRLAVSVRTDVEAHLRGCGDCRAELLILRQVVAISPAPALDTRRIASAIAPYRAKAAWRRLAGSPQLRIAAGVVLLAGGAAVLTRTRDRESVPVGREIATAPSSPVSSQPSVTGSLPAASTGAPAEASQPAVRGATALAVGEPYHDLTTAELRELLDEVGKLDAITSAETDVVIPALNRGGA